MANAASLTLYQYTGSPDARVLASVSMSILNTDADGCLSSDDVVLDPSTSWVKYVVRREP